MPLSPNNKEKKSQRNGPTTSTFRWAKIHEQEYKYVFVVVHNTSTQYISKYLLHYKYNRKNVYVKKSNISEMMLQQFRQLPTYTYSPYNNNQTLG